MKDIFAVGIDVTNKCTLQCLHCYNSSGENERYTEQLDDTELWDVLNKVLECLPQNICICGGEPLLRYSIVKKFTSLAQRTNPNVQINMVTNGELLTYEMAEELWKSGMKNIQVSLDGASPETVDWLRNKTGSFFNATRAIKYLYQTRIDSEQIISVAFCPTKRNMNEIEKTMDLCEAMGVNTFRVQPLMLMGRAKKNLINETLNSEEYMILSKKIKERNREHLLGKKKMETIWADPIDHLLNDELGDRIALQVDAYGNLYPSIYIPISMGNIKENNLKDYLDFDWKYIWNHPLFKLVRYSMVTPEKLGLCNELRLPEVGKGNISFDLKENDWEIKMNKFYSKIKKGGAI